MHDVTRGKAPVAAFPLNDQQLVEVAEIIRLVRGTLPQLSPGGLYGTSALLLALERLPRATNGVEVLFGFRTPSVDGHCVWAEMIINEKEFRLSSGEYRYGPYFEEATESRDLFTVHVFGECGHGDIAEWLDTARYTFAIGNPVIEDESDHSKIKWVDWDEG